MYGSDSYQDFGVASNSEYEVSCAARLCRSVASTRYNKTKEPNNKESKMKVSALITKKTVQVKFVGQTQNDK